jgi:hypothetical protein
MSGESSGRQAAYKGGVWAQTGNALCACEGHVCVRLRPLLLWRNTWCEELNIKAAGDHPPKNGILEHILTRSTIMLYQARPKAAHGGPS